MVTWGRTGGQNKRKVGVGRVLLIESALIIGFELARAVGRVIVEVLFGRRVSDHY